LHHIAIQSLVWILGPFDAGESPCLQYLKASGTHMERRYIRNAVTFDYRNFSMVEAGGVEINAPIENTQPIQKSKRWKRSGIRKRTQLERTWNMAFCATTVFVGLMKSIW